MKKLSKTPAEYSKEYKLMPADFLLRVMNGYEIEDVIETKDGFITVKRKPAFKEQMAAASTVIAYLHPKLTSVVIEDKSNLEVIDEDELLKKAKEIMAELKAKT